MPGLRREEVATLAGLSVDYYNRLEPGNLGGASDSVLDALADALRLDEAERAYLLDLARASKPSSRRRRRSTTQTIRPSVQWMLDSMTASAAFAENGRLDALGANQLGRALYPAVFGQARQPANWARFVFLNKHARNFYGDRDRAAKDCVAILRSEAGRNPHDRELSDLVGQLATQSEEFRGLWAAHNVRLHTKGVKRFNHPVGGELALSFDQLEVAADPGADDRRLNRRAGLAVCGGVRSTRELGSDRRGQRSRLYRCCCPPGGPGRAIATRVRDKRTRRTPPDAPHRTAFAFHAREHSGPRVALCAICESDAFTAGSARRPGSSAGDPHAVTHTFGRGPLGDGLR